MDDECCIKILQSWDLTAQPPGLIESLKRKVEVGWSPIKCEQILSVEYAKEDVECGTSDFVDYFLAISWLDDQNIWRYSEFTVDSDFTFGDLIKRLTEE